MRCMRIAILLSVSFTFPRVGFVEAQQWSAEETHTWCRQNPWLVGSNFIPASAINQLEMWQADTFDPREIDRELGWAEAIGMNTMRVFLHDLLWEQDASGFKQRIDTVLSIATKHHIRVLLVLFDSCWDPFPKLGSTAHADTWSPQFWMGAESGEVSAGGFFAIPAAQSLRRRNCWGICQ